MHLKDLLLRFNVSHFLFYCTLLVESILIGLRIDDIIKGPYTIVFIPLWIWNIVMIVGVVLGIARWCKSPDQRDDEQYTYQFKSMIISVCLQLYIIWVEIMTVVNLDVGDTPIPWSAVFSPIYILMLISIPSCIWGCYRKRGVEIEVLAMTSFVQFIFLGVRMDNAVTWNWAIVFIPFWLLYLALIISLILIGIATILSYVIGENQQANEEKKLPDTIYFISTILFSLFLIIFMALLVVRLNGDIIVSYSIVFIPLYLSLLALIGTTFSRSPANVWWFGIRKNFIDSSLDCCPLFQEYANVSYKKETTGGGDDGSPGSTSSRSKKKKNKLKTLIDIEEQYPYEDIYAPD